ncbi:MAG: hypothetical protein LBQ67_07495 [Treponema sp.]|jgi:hypothetical protein|nr:hypothetical protein [Treponema sp.]
MGLLTKAAGREDPELDEMGRALLYRIRRLPPRKTTPYAALTLLKAYGFFQAGICFSLWKGIYVSYAVIGLGVEKISIHNKKLYSPQYIQSIQISGRPFIRLPNTAELGALSADKDLCYWAFPLDGENPWGALVVLGDNKNPLFNPLSLGKIIQGALEIFNPQIDQIDKIITSNSRTAPPASRPPVIPPDPLERAIAQFNKANSPFNGILLELPAGMDRDKQKAENFNKAVYNMTALLGITIILPSRRSLVLLPHPVDKELIAHRLSNSLNTKALAVFEAKTPREALDLIRSYR